MARSACRLTLIPRAIVRDIARQDYVVAGEDAALFEIIARMRASGASICLVVHNANLHSPNAADVIGTITKEQIADAVVEATELFAD